MGLTHLKLGLLVCLKDIHLDTVRIFAQGVQKFGQTTLYTVL